MDVTVDEQQVMGDERAEQAFTSVGNPRRVRL